MRKWRAENREKNRQNDLRCRVYRLARQKFGDADSVEKQGFVREEIARRLGRRMLMEKRESNSNKWSDSQKQSTMPSKGLVELPFYSAPQQKIELPSIEQLTRASIWSSSPPDFSSSSSGSSSPVLPHLSPTLERRTSSSSVSSNSSSVCIQQQQSQRRSMTPVPGSLLLYEEKASGEHKENDDKDNKHDEFRVLPSMHAFLSYAPTPNQLFNQQQQQKQKRCISTKGGIKYVEPNKILDEFVGVVLNYVDNTTVAQ